MIISECSDASYIALMYIKWGTLYNKMSNLGFNVNFCPFHGILLYIKKNIQECFCFFEIPFFLYFLQCIFIRKNKPKMNYEKLSRGLRYDYDMNKLFKIKFFFGITNISFFVLFTVYYY